ncbi:MAG: class I SAM-dependent methyltransferase, partial [Lachnospiraceae bacterium]|nr:class I SAM-dependent methyltransferase [Lachnospiraceae bacterium]
MGNYDFSLDLESVNTMSVINGWIKEGSRILEFGPANGRLTKYLKEEKDCRMTIVEIDGETGREASAFAEKAYLGEEGDIEKFKWTAETEPFDYIIFADVLEHLHCPDRVLKEASDLLKPEGEILVSVPNITHNSILIDLINDRFDYDETGLLDRTHVHFFSYDSFVKMCG